MKIYEIKENINEIISELIHEFYKKDMENAQYAEFSLKIEYEAIKYNLDDVAENYAVWVYDEVKEFSSIDNLFDFCKNYEQYLPIITITIEAKTSEKTATLSKSISPSSF